MELAHPPIWMILLAFVCALGPLVFFHELGHYLVGRLFKVPADYSDAYRINQALRGESVPPQPTAQPGANQQK